MEWQALDATLALEYAAWAAVAVVKFVVTPSLMMAIGHPWWVAWAVTAAGGAAGACGWSGLRQALVFVV